ncbi:MAG TPA: ISNCY family transposase [Terriglobia bacterium]|nr:ISNCY family transposase [Terriglobia bacterium]
MNQKERDRLKVLHEAEKGHLTQKQAGVQLKLSERWVRELVGRLRKEGDGGILHRLRGRASKRKLSAAVRAKVVRLVKREYAGFGPTLAAEYLGEKHGVVMSKESVRQILMEAGVWKRKRRRVEPVHVWRARRPCCGEMVQWDSSEHDWLEGRGPKLSLLAMLDDATSRAQARFAEHDTTEENFRLLESYLKRWGRPGEFYTDKDSLFTVNRPVREADDEAWPEAWTQIGRALKELGIGWIAAHSPQAKGRIERFFGTAQDRLVKGLRQAGAQTLKEANAYWEQEYLPMWNRRFTVEAEKVPRCTPAAAGEAEPGGDPEPRRGARGGQRLHDSVQHAEIPDPSGGYPSGITRRDGAGGGAARPDAVGTLPGSLPEGEPV